MASDYWNRKSSCLPISKRRIRPKPNCLLNQNTSTSSLSTLCYLCSQSDTIIAVNNFQFKYALKLVNYRLKEFLGADASLNCKNVRSQHFAHRSVNCGHIRAFFRVSVLKQAAHALQFRNESRMLRCRPETSDKLVGEFLGTGPVVR